MIQVVNLTKEPLNEEFLKKVAKTVLKKERIKGKELSIVLAGPKKIQELNRKYRKKNQPTDVLAFGETSSKSELGDIVICVAVVKKNAKKFKSTFKKELVRVLIHGILHLLGYGHEKFDKGAKIMEEKQKFYLSQILKS